MAEKSYARQVAEYLRSKSPGGIQAKTDKGKKVSPRMKKFREGLGVGGKKKAKSPGGIQAKTDKGKKASPRMKKSREGLGVGGKKKAKKESK